MAVATTLGPVPLMPVPARLRFGVDVPDPKFSPPPARRQSVRRSELLRRYDIDTSDLTDERFERGSKIGRNIRDSAAQKRFRPSSMRP